jgi:hypothetical protein
MVRMDQLPDVSVTGKWCLAAQSWDPQVISGFRIWTATTSTR